MQVTALRQNQQYIQCNLVNEQWVCSEQFFLMWKDHLYILAVILDSWSHLFLFSSATPPSFIFIHYHDFNLLYCSLHWRWSACVIRIVRRGTAAALTAVKVVGLDDPLGVLRYTGTLNLAEKKKSYLSEEFHRHFACTHNNMTSLIMQVILNITALLMLPGKPCIKAKLPYVTLLLHKLETLHAYSMINYKSR